MRSGLVGWAAIAALLMSAAPVLAAQGTLHGHSGTPILASGHVEASAHGASFLLAGDDGQASLLLQGAEGKATRVTQRAYGVASTQDPKAEVLWQQRVETTALDLKGALLSLDGRETGFRALAYDADANVQGGGANEPLQLGLLRKDQRVTEDLTRPLSVQVTGDVQPFDRTLPAGLYETGASGGHVTADGAMKLFLSGATLAWHGADGTAQTIRAYFHPETRPGALYNPIDDTWFGVGSHTEYVQEYLLVDAAAGHLDLQFDGTWGALYAQDPTFAVDGQATLPHMEGTVNVQDKDQVRLHTLAGQDLTLAGRFTLAPTSADDDGLGTQVDGSGDITTVAYGAVSAHYDWTTAAVAVGLGAIALAGAAWALAHGKALLGSLGGGLVAGYARVHGEDVLDHPGRAEVYERIKGFPGVNFVQLSVQVEFGASTLNYHLRVLEKNGYIASVRDGRYLRFFDRTSGAYAGGRKMAVSALRNETTAAMAKRIREHPGIAQCDLAAAFSVTPSTVTWHINRLAVQGLVQKARDGAHTRYYIGTAWAQLPAEEQVRQAGVPVSA